MYVTIFFLCHLTSYVSIENQSYDPNNLFNCYHIIGETDIFIFTGINFECSRTNLYFYTADVRSLKGNCNKLKCKQCVIYKQLLHIHIHVCKGKTLKIKYLFMMMDNACAVLFKCYTHLSMLERQY